jgi:hypothetical protein
MRTMTRALLALAVVLSLASSATPASAISVGSGNCVQSVGSSTGISVTTYSDRCVVKFTSTTGTTWTVPRGVTKVWILLVGGGGGGGGDEGGGGGGGGYIENQNFAVTSSSTISLDIGSGGAGVQDTTASPGGKGEDSTFASLTAVGGGGGGNGYNASNASIKNGADGGSGGGGAGESSYILGVGGSPTSGQGFAGGGGYAARGGGGGGAAEAGNTNGASRGGDGKVTNILDGTSNVYYAGGGGGGGGNSVTSGSVAGGAGGGGAGGGGSTCGTVGTANTGGGGGGSGGTCDSFLGNDGGSGVIIINYQFDITSPEITSPFIFSKPENTSTESLITTVRASESTTITMAGGSDSADFTLTYSDSTSVFLKFASVPNYELPGDSDFDNIYAFTLNLEDYSGNVSTKIFSITVTDVNEAPVIGAFSGAVSAAYSVSENTTGLFNINATDVDAGTILTYSLTGTDANDFTISSSGALAFSPAADFEAPTDDGANNTYVVVTWASDGALSDSQTVTITVTNSNESGTLGTPTLSATPYKGISVNLSVTINAAGKVRFLVGNKRIPNCLAVAATGAGSTFTATCSWKPASTGMQKLSASFTPSSGTFSSATSPTLSVRVFKRTTTR